LISIRLLIAIHCRRTTISRTTSPSSNLPISNITIMGYPETATGFVVKDPKQYVTVCQVGEQPLTRITDGNLSTRRSSSSRHLRKTMSTSPLMHAVSVVPTSTVRHGIPKSNNWLLTQTAITGGWGETPLPLCVGHEIIGTLHTDQTISASSFPLNILAMYAKLLLCNNAHNYCSNNFLQTHC
jgi:hypothetical protein